MFFFLEIVIIIFSFLYHRNIIGSLADTLKAQRNIQSSSGHLCFGGNFVSS